MLDRFIQQVAREAVGEQVRKVAATTNQTVRKTASDLLDKHADEIRKANPALTQEQALDQAYRQHDKLVEWHWW